jgi:adenosine deaminase
VKLVLGDDNPMQTGTNLRDEREVLQNVLGFTTTDLDAIDRVSVEAAFLDDGERSALAEQLTS